MTSLNVFPNELLLEIARLSCDSQETYRSTLLVNKRFHDIVKLDRLPHIPIRIHSKTLRSFHEYVTELGMAKHIRYLWINGSSIQASLVGETVRACTNLVALGCSKIALHALCTPATADAEFQHNELKELTLFGSFECWQALKALESTHPQALCRQITHLRVQDALTPDFDATWFPALTHYSCNLPLGGHVGYQLARVVDVPDLTSIVLTTFHWKNESPSKKTEEMLGKDHRIKFIFMGLDANEFALWCGRARNTDCIWSKDMEIKSLC